MKRRILQIAHRGAGCRRGILLVDAIVAAILLGAAMSMLIPSLAAVRHQRQLHRFESLAMLELNNIAEFLPSSIDSSNPPNLSPWFQKRYATAQLNAELVPSAIEQTGETLQAIRLTIQRPGAQSTPDQRVSIVVWKRVEESTP